MMFDAYLVVLIAGKDVLTDWLTDGHLHFLSFFRSWKLSLLSKIDDKTPEIIAIKVAYP